VSASVITRPARNFPASSKRGIHRGEWIVAGAVECNPRRRVCGGAAKARSCAASASPHGGPPLCVLFLCGAPFAWPAAKLAPFAAHFAQTAAARSDDDASRCACDSTRLACQVRARPETRLSFHFRAETSPQGLFQSGSPPRRLPSAARRRAFADAAWRLGMLDRTAG
jgi:hypothetical protein